MSASESVAEVVKRLRLQPHVEGGNFRETWRTSPEAGIGDRGSASAIYYLLAKGEKSHWHRVTDADELWLWHAGSPLSLYQTEQEGTEPKTSVLGGDVTKGESPQVLIKKGWWQAAEPMGDWTLVTCIVAPGFLPDKFVMAPPGWSPTPSSKA